MATPVDEEEEELLHHLSGVRALETTALEHEFDAALTSALAKHDADLEARRLAKVRVRIQQVEARLAAGGSLGPVRVAKLWERRDELGAEEEAILERMKGGGVELGGEEVDVLPRKRVVEFFSDSEPDAVDVESPEEDSAEPPILADEENDEVDDIDDDYSDQAYHSRLRDWMQDDWDLASLLENKPLADQSIFAGPSLDVLGMWMPEGLWNALLPYQKEGVEWLIGQFQRRTGGILGDDMGLGKTVQIIGMLAALQLSGRIRAPMLIVCPVTLMRQWVRELQHWWPALRVLRLHSSSGHQDLQGVLRKARRCAHVLITSYGHVRQFVSVLEKVEWSGVVLDEGHAVRNPEAAVTLACKRLRTPRRWILSGTPIQNGLMELWSLVDFAAPGHLGSLQVFKAELAAPIVAGGYVGAGTLQVQTAYRCACVLRGLLKDVLLRRVKADVATQLPPKQEHVLLCELTEYQRRLYEWLLETDIIQSCLAGKRNVLAGIDLLRKVCNDPELILGGPLGEEPDIPQPGNAEDAQPGKLRVVRATLSMWIERGHKALLFCQTRQMLSRVEGQLLADGILYLRMDGTTGISERSVLVDRFNKDASISVFLLTTRVGGLGLNLTGADRVLIYDPDWNPSTDLQARERAWRLGQSRPVTIYRLLAAGSIEEKIYQRQLWKQQVTSRVLSDPKQARFFRASELYDLFTLAPAGGQSETGDLLSGLGVVSSSTEKKGKKEEEEEEDAQHIVADLFQALPGLHSAIAHDKLVERPRQEILLVEREAERMARSATEALLRSRREHDTEPSTTGRGIIASSTSTTSVPSSAAVLAAVRARKNEHTAGGLDDRLAKLLDRLLKFLADGAASSDAIAGRFKDQLAPGQEAAFRAILRTVAVFDAATRTWRLKPNLTS